MGSGSRVPGLTHMMGPGSRVSSPTKSLGSEIPLFGYATNLFKFAGIDWDKLYDSDVLNSYFLVVEFQERSIYYLT